MRKLIYFLLVLSFFTIHPAFAQSFFGFGSSNKSTPVATTQAPTSMPAQAPRVLTPDQFKAASNQAVQQAQSQLQSQYQQDLAKRPPIPTQQIATPPVSNINTPQTPAASSFAPAPAPPITGTVAQPGAPSSVAPTTVPIPSQQPQTPIYSGFQSPPPANSNQGTDTSQGSAQGNWKIKY